MKSEFSGESSSSSPRVMAQEPPKKKVKQEKLEVNLKSSIVDLTRDNQECVIADAPSRKPMTFVAVDDDDDAEIKLTPLPYKKLVSMMVPPTKMVAEVQNRRCSGSVYRDICEYRSEFNISEKDCDLIANEKIKAEVYLRVCHMKNGAREISDCFPEHVDVQVNGLDVGNFDVDSLNPESSDFYKPINITERVHWTAEKKNDVLVRWIPNDPPEQYVICVSLWKSLSTNEEVAELQAKALPSSFTKEKIRQILSSTDDISAPESVTVSLKCPLSQQKMKNPCRGINCKHVQCFDAESFVSMVLELENLTPKCPICNDFMDLKDLRIDGYFVSVLKALDKAYIDSTEIVILSDARWSPK